MRELRQNERKFCRHSYTIWKINSCSFPTRRRYDMSRSFYLKFWAKLTPPLQKMAISKWYALIAPQPLHLAKKFIVTSRKSSTAFPMSLIWTAYVASKPQSGRFPIKVDFFRRKSATKLLCVKTFSGRVVRYSLAYLSVHKWLVGDVASYLKFWAKMTNPLEKHRLQIDIRL